MKKLIVSLAVFAAIAIPVMAQTAIDPLTNDIELRKETIKQINLLIADKDAGVTFTNTVAASVTNLSIVVIGGKVTSVTINGSVTP